MNKDEEEYLNEGRGCVIWIAIFIAAALLTTIIYNFYST